MKFLYTFCFCILFVDSYSQGVPFDTFRVSRIRLQQDWKVEKMVVYEINKVKIGVDYKEYKKNIYKMWRSYKKSYKEVREDARKGEIGSIKILNCYIVIDSIYRLLKKEIKQKDTILLRHETFESVGLRCLMDMSIQLEKGTCAIFDENNKRIFGIIRKKGSWYKGHKHAWGGRRYYLPDHENYFFEARDWIS